VWSANQKRRPPWNASGNDSMGLDNAVSDALPPPPRRAASCRRDARRFRPVARSPQHVRPSSANEKEHRGVLRRPARVAFCVTTCFEHPDATDRKIVESPSQKTSGVFPLIFEAKPTLITRTPHVNHAFYYLVI
jgi:hypothetical protein